jgi:hypothetical protein
MAHRARSPLPGRLLAGTTSGRLPAGSVANVRLNRRSRLPIFKNITLTYLNTALNGWLLVRARKAAVQLTPH